MKKIIIITDNEGHEKEISQLSADFMKQSLEEIGHQVEMLYFPDDKDIFTQIYKDFDLTIPVIHGGIGESGELTKLLQELGIEYIFSDSDVHGLCLDKYKTNLKVEYLGIKVPKSILIQTSLDSDRLLDDNIEKSERLGNTVFVKPNKSGSSIDCGKFDDIKEAENLINKILEYDDVIIQEYIPGREFTVAIYKDFDKDPEVLGTMEILTEREFFDYKAKYERAGTKEIFPELEEDFRNIIEGQALDIYKEFRIKTLSRIDFIYDGKDFYFLEINTIPGMTNASFVPQCVKNYGFESFGEFMKQFID